MIKRWILHHVQILVEEKLPESHQMFNVKLLDRKPPDTIDNEEPLQLVGNNDNVLEPLLSQDSGTEGIIRILPEAAYDIRLV